MKKGDLLNFTVEFDFAAAERAAAQRIADMIDDELTRMALSIDRNNVTDGRGVNLTPDERKAAKNSYYAALYGGKMTTVRFIGGPLDGQTRDILSPGKEWRVLRPASIFAYAWRPESLSDPFPELVEETYIRQDVGVVTDGNDPYRYTLYFYAGVKKRRPSMGDRIRYNGETYIVDDITPDGFLAHSVTFEASRPLRTSRLIRGGMETIIFKDGAVYWSNISRSWEIRSGSQIKTEVDSDQVAP